jgi:hypothetical protein
VVTKLVFGFGMFSWRELFSGNTTRNVLIDDLHPSSLKMPNWSCTQIYDELLTKLISSLKSRHIM